MAESKRISDLITAEDITPNDLLLLSSFVDQENYTSRKTGLGLLALAMLSDFTFDDQLTTETKSIIGAINDLVKIERNGAVSGCIFVKCGKVVHVYGNPTNLAATATVNIGTTPFKPANNYAVMPFVGGTAPYNSQIGTLWIDKNGSCTVYKTASTTSGYVYGTYICE